MSKRLTKAEEEIMQIIWSKGRVLVSDILDELGDPRPPHSSISSIVRILEKKGFVDHKAYGRTYEYFPIVAKEEYSKHSIRNFIADYFGGNANSLVSFLVKENDLSIKELTQLAEQLKSSKKK
jgi:predicted transcriptional regulator